MILIKMERLTAVLVLLVLIKIIAAGVVIEVKFDRFENDAGLKANGKKCDRYVSTRKCDTKFVFCLELREGTCDLGRYVADHFDDQNTVDFDSPILETVENPICNKTSRWPGKIKLYVTVTDVDWFSDDAIDAFVHTISSYQPNTNGLHVWHDVNLMGTREAHPTQLYIKYMVYCATHYYGPSCTVYCRAHDDNVNGHYTCENPTGRKICRLGWLDTDTNCLQREHCENWTCHNGATCIENDRGYRCECPHGFTGQYCEVPNNCTNGQCANNGSCVTSPNGESHCECPQQFKGDRCQEQNLCFSNPCQNGAECRGFGKWYICDCPPNYIGSQCEVKDPCVTSPCQHGGACWTSWTKAHCSCRPGYTGRYCETKDPCYLHFCEESSWCEVQEGRAICYQNGEGEGKIHPLLWAPVVALVLVMLLLTIGAFVQKKRKHKPKRESSQQLPHLGQVTPEHKSNVYDDLPKVEISGPSDVYEDITTLSRVATVDDLAADHGLQGYRYGTNNPTFVSDLKPASQA